MAMKVKTAILFLMFGTQVGCQFERRGQEGLGEESPFERYVRLLDVDAVAFMNDEKLLTIEDLPLMSDETFEDALALKRTDIRFFELLCGWYLSKFDLYYRSHLRQTYPVVEDPFRKIDWKSESRRNGSYFVYANFVLLTGRDKTIGPTGHDDSHWYAHEATEYMSDILFKHIEKRCLRSREVRVLREWSRVALLK